MWSPKIMLVFVPNFRRNGATENNTKATKTSYFRWQMLIFGGLSPSKVNCIPIVCRVRTLVPLHGLTTVMPYIVQKTSESFKINPCYSLKTIARSPPHISHDWPPSLPCSSSCHWCSMLYLREYVGCLDVHDGWPMIWLDSLSRHIGMEIGASSTSFACRSPLLAPPTFGSLMAIRESRWAASISMMDGPLCLAPCAKSGELKAHHDIHSLIDLLSLYCLPLAFWWPCRRASGVASMSMVDSTCAIYAPYAWSGKADYGVGMQAPEKWREIGDRSSSASTYPKVVLLRFDTNTSFPMVLLIVCHTCVLRSCLYKCY